MKGITAAVGLTVIFGLLGACSDKEAYSFGEVINDKVDHIHGAGYINNSNQFVIATHEGLYSYEDEWKEANKEKHDYMGFAPVSDGFYSSGHPEPDSEYENPLGLVKSVDQGASFEKLAFYGETDFHYMTAGYETNTIYVFNEMPNNVLDIGFYYTEDEGENWSHPEMVGFNSDRVTGIAAHPEKSGTVAIASMDGLFLSDDYGDTFELFGEPETVTAVQMNGSGGIYSTISKAGAQLFSFDRGNQLSEELNGPDIKSDNPIIEIAVNPNDVDEITIVTVSNDIYQTKDSGANWSKIADNGYLN